jgi:hypothetical protein
MDWVWLAVFLIVSNEQSPIADLYYSICVKRYRLRSVDKDIAKGCSKSAIGDG